MNGWICPKCGNGVSPFCAVCPCGTPAQTVSMPNTSPVPNPTSETTTGPLPKATAELLMEGGSDWPSEPGWKREKREAGKS